MRYMRALACVLIVCGGIVHAEGTIALVGGTLIDGNGGRPVENAVILIRGERIAATGRGGSVEVPPDAERYDVTGKYVLPGFIDAHVHFMYPPDGREQSEGLSALRALHFMDLHLAAGITSVRDTGGTIEAMQALDQAQRLGYIRSVRMHSVGQLITSTGGHGPPWSHFASGADGFRQAVRTMYEAGFRYIKLSPPYTQEEVNAAVDEAKIRRMRITSHGGGFSDTEPPSMTRRAVLAGVQCIEHLNQMPLDVLDMIAQRHVHVVPTLQTLKLAYDLPTPWPEFTYLKEKRGWTMAMHEELFRQARKRGIVMGIGTDAVAGMLDKVYPRMYFDEMEYFVRLGLTRLEAITAATKNGAIILGRETELGTLEQGKFADLQVVRGDPLTSFSHLGNPEIVVLGGQVVSTRRREGTTSMRSHDSSAARCID